MHGTSVTVVLYGTQTYTRPWVHYEIRKSYQERRGLLGISLQGMSGFIGGPEDGICIDPFPIALKQVSNFGAPHVPAYNWVRDNGRQNINSWIEAAARSVGR